VPRPESRHSAVSQRSAGVRPVSARGRRGWGLGGRPGVAEVAQRAHASQVAVVVVVVPPGRAEGGPPPGLGPRPRRCHSPLRGGPRAALAVAPLG